MSLTGHRVTSGTRLTGHRLSGEQIVRHATAGTSAVLRENGNTFVLCEDGSLVLRENT